MGNIKQIKLDLLPCGYAPSNPSEVTVYIQLHSSRTKYVEFDWAAAHTVQWNLTGAQYQHIQRPPADLEFLKYGCLWKVALLYICHPIHIFKPALVFQLFAYISL